MSDLLKVVVRNEFFFAIISICVPSGFVQSQYKLCLFNQMGENRWNSLSMKKAMRCCYVTRENQITWETLQKHPNFHWSHCSHNAKRKSQSLCKASRWSIQIFTHWLQKLHTKIKYRSKMLLIDVIFTIVNCTQNWSLVCQFKLQQS